MTSAYDLHCHSHCSDGTLSPTDVVIRAAANGVKVLAITDHDQTSAYQAALAAAHEHSVQLITGVEISTRWLNYDIHLLGLAIDIQDANLQTGLAMIRDQRQRRAQLIAEKLAQAGIADALAGARELGGDFIGRLHFAKFLVSRGYSMSIQAAFDHYLGQGKKAYVATEWVPLANAVAWIKQAGGISVIAHPLRYRLKTKKVRQLLQAFKQMGGDGVEVISGNMATDSIKLVAAMANKLELLASLGSDFHSPELSWADLGKLQCLPDNCCPVWQDPRFHEGFLLDAI